MVNACREAGVEVIAVTDHYRIRDSVSLINAARKIVSLKRWGEDR